MENLLKPILNVALFKPEIHPNTGNIARLCAANEIPLYLLGNLGFRIDDKSVRRAGLDYWPHVQVATLKDLDELRSSLPDCNFYFFSARARRSYLEMEYRRGDCLIFGPESTGLPKEILEANADTTISIPMRSPHIRSLNLSSSAAIGVYEALRQISRKTNPPEEFSIG